MVNKGLIEMSVQYKDYYEILGVSRTASADEIRRAYRKLAKQYHPDVCKEKDAEARYKEINEAYEVLKDPDKRQKYDTLGMNWQAGQDFTPPPGWEGEPGGVHMEFGGDMGGFSDFFKTLFGGGGGFSDFFSGAQRGGFRRQPVQRDSEVDLELSLEDAVRGGTHTLVLSGRGNNRRTLNVRLPQGITEGSQIRLPGKANGGGDIYVNLHLAPHPIFEVSGFDLTREMKVAPWEAVLGGDIRVETLTGSVTMKMPPGIQDGQRLRLRGKGMPRRDGGSGDLFVRIRIEIPRHLTDKQRELWQELAKLG